MTYTVGIPNDGQSLGNSKPQVRANFSDLFTYLAKNHFDLNLTNAGKHRFIEMPNVSNQTTVADECGIYGQSLGPTPFANMVWQQESGGADALRNQGAIIQMTGIKPKTTGASGWTFLPGGLLLQWDNVTSPSGGVSTVTFPQPFKSATIPFSIMVTQNSQMNLLNAYSADNRTAADFRLTRFGPNSSFSVFYMAIGLSS